MKTTLFIKNLSKSFQQHSAAATEIWIAVGLLNFRGLTTILDSLPKKCIVNIIVGIDLPTDPKALEHLLVISKIQKIRARVLTSDFFHPKVYIVQSGGKLVSFVGSANCTIGGLEKNVEMTCLIKDPSTCQGLLNWFNEELVPGSQVLTGDFIKDYKKTYMRRMKRAKTDKKEVESFKRKEEKKQLTFIKEKAKFISRLREERSRPSYLADRKYRLAIVQKLRKSIDYPRFAKIDLDEFFRIKELGTIIPIKLKGVILKDPKRFSEAMRYLCDDSISLSEKIDNVLHGRFYIPEVGPALISKILVIHDPKKYYLHNNLFTKRLKPFGLHLPRGCSFGIKYEATLEVLEGVLLDTGISDFATLDMCIWHVQ